MIAVERSRVSLAPTPTFRSASSLPTLVGAQGASRSILHAATSPDGRTRRRVVHVDPRKPSIAIHTFDDALALLDAGDVLVVNDAATLPARLLAELAGHPVELRMLALPTDGQVDVVLMTPASHRTRTEDRPAPIVPRIGDVVELGSGVRAVVSRVDPSSVRRVRLVFACATDELVRLVYRRGSAIQYAHVGDKLALWDVQNVFAGAPLSVEMPSASRGITFERLATLRARGVVVTHLTHGAGISTTGDDVLDRKLPFAERYVLPRATAEAIREARASGARIVASGTSVVRALESSAVGTGAVRAGADVTELRLSPGSRLAVVDGLLTGLHEPGTSHHELCSAFAPPSLLDAALDEAAAHGFENHELGDFMLVLGARR